VTTKSDTRTLLVFAALMTGAAFVGALAAPLPIPWQWSWPATGALLFGVFLVVLIRGDAIGSLVNPLYLFTALVAFAQTWLVNEIAVRIGPDLRPFDGYKLVPFGVAFLAPEALWVGVGVIAASAILSLAQLFTWPASFRAHVPASEPWVTLLACAGALIVLLHRRRELGIQREAVRIGTKTAAAERFLRKFLAVRDLTNSPVQAIEATVSVLQARHADSTPQLERISRQLDRLRKLSTVLLHYEPQMWKPEDESFDPLKVLQDLEDSPTRELDEHFLVGPDPRETNIDLLFRFTSFGLERAPVGAFWLGEDGRLVYVNQESCRSLGYTRSELLGMHISSFAPRVRREDWAARFASFREGPSRSYPSLHRRKDGVVIAVHITASYAELGGRGYILGFAEELRAQQG
jgi:PAS domain S-box-containing protein